MKLAIVASHPVQYYAPLYRELSKLLDLTVFYGHRPTGADQARAGFGVPFAWDVDLTTGYKHVFLTNVSPNPNLARFSGVDTPQIQYELNAGQFDGVLVMGWYLKTFIQSVISAKKMRMPVLVRGDSQIGMTTSPVKTAAKGVLYPALLRLFDAALYVGARNYDYYRHYLYPQSRLFHSPHAVDTARFAAAASPEARQSVRERLGVMPNEKLVLFAGKLVPFKRPLDAVNIVARLRQQGCDTKLAIAGAGELEADVKSLATELSVPLCSLGFVNQSRMPGVYAAADALILPSTRRETWGLVCNEALACGLPIIVSDQVGCAPDLCVDPEVGQTYPCGDTKLASDALTLMLENPPSPERIARVSETFSLKLAAEGISHALASVV